MLKTGRNTPALRWEWAVWVVVLAAAAFPASASGQEAHAAAASPFVFAHLPAEPDDPAYTLYRQGYTLVLAEQWEKARAKFAELGHQYPGSPYADDAAYWTAVSWKRTDRERAALLYRALLREFPQSPYVADAVADLRYLEVEEELARVPHPPPALMEHQELRIGFPRELLHLRKDLERLQELQHIRFRYRLTVIGEGDTLIIRTPPPLRQRATAGFPRLDPATRTRIEAMQMLSDAGDTKQTYKVLREIALDTRQPVAVRITAVHGLGNLSNRNNAAVLLDVARADSNADVQRTAIQVFAQSAADKKRAVEDLIVLFRRFDESKRTHDPRLGTTLYSIASIGDARATDFLADIARAHRDDDLRSSAVFYLGTMGTERSRAALIRLLRGE